MCRLYFHMESVTPSRKYLRSLYFFGKTSLPNLSSFFSAEWLKLFPNNLRGVCWRTFDPSADLNIWRDGEPAFSWLNRWKVFLFFSFSELDPDPRIKRGKRIALLKKLNTEPRVLLRWHLSVWITLLKTAPFDFKAVSSAVSGRRKNHEANKGKINASYL